MSDRYMTRSEYWDEIRSIAENVKEGVREVGGDIYDRLHEEIDSHQWVIYTAFHLEVLNFSPNADYGVGEGLVDAKQSLRDGGMGNLTMALTFWAMYADVSDEIGNWRPEDDEDEEERE